MKTMIINGTPSNANGLSLSPKRTPGHWARFVSGVGLCVVLGGSAVSVCAPVCSHAATPATTTQMVADGTFLVYVYDAFNNPVQVVGAYKGFQEGAVYTDSAVLLGYIDPDDDTILRDASDNVIGYIVY